MDTGLGNLVNELVCAGTLATILATSAPANANETDYSIQHTQNYIVAKESYDKEVTFAMLKYEGSKGTDIVLPKEESNTWK